MSSKLELSLEEDNETRGERVNDLESDTQVNTTEVDNKPERSPTVVVMKGPLSEIYTKALDIVFNNNNKNGGLGIVASESMLNDVVMQAAMKEANNIKKPTLMTLIVSDDYSSSTDIAYTTTAVDFNSNKAIGVVGALSELSKSYPSANVSLVVDGGAEGRYGAGIGTPNELGLADNDNIIVMKDSMESICNKLGFKVYYSLESYIKALSKK